MKGLRYFLIASVLFVLCPRVWAFADHRVLVLDNISRRMGSNAVLRIVEAESGHILASAEVGHSPLVTLSPRGDTIAVISDYFVGGRTQANSRLEFFRSNDLKRLERGLLPATGRTVYQIPPPFPVVQVSPNGKEILIQKMESVIAFDSVSIICVKRQLDEEGVFEKGRNSLKVPRCRNLRFLRVDEWPLVHVWNEHLGVLEVLDFESGKIVSRLVCHDDPVLKVLDPVELERPAIGNLYQRRFFRGDVVSDGRFAYYVPNQPCNSTEPSFKGLLRKIDLGAKTQKVIRKSKEGHGDLRASVIAVSDQAGALFVVKEKLHANGCTHQPSRRIKIFSTVSLELQNEIDVSIPDCQSLNISQDGKLLYALNHEEAKVAIVSVATGKETNLLRNVGKFPVMLIPLPERAK